MIRELAGNARSRMNIDIATMFLAAEIGRIESRE
jgi:hypothetical protein